MSEMIERVAKALFLRETKPAREQFPGDDGWDSMLSEAGREMWRGMARAAIEAMREPTKDMQAAVEGDAVIQSGLDDCNKHDIPDNAWRLMIDAALGGTR